MTGSLLIMLALKASVAMMVFSVGLQSTTRDATYVVRHPALIARSFLAMFVVMPLLAVLLGTSFRLTPIVSLALVALTMSPVPPLLPGRALRAGGDGSYMAGLLTAASLAAVVVVPCTVAVLGAVFAAPLHVSPLVILELVGGGILLPFAAGIGLRALVSGAGVLARPISLVSILMLVGALIPLLIRAWPAFVMLTGNGTIVAIIALTIGGLAVGHLLGGPEPGDRTVLALATALRHPGVAIAILGANFPEERSLTAAVVLALLVGAIASAPYTIWRKRQRRRQAVDVGRPSLVPPTAATARPASAPPVR